MRKLTAILLGLSASALASITLEKHATCTVASAGNSGVDDVPAAVAAIESCGNGGVVVFSAGKTYAIRSTFDITGCVNCQIQIEGTLKLSDDTTFWNGKRAVIYINGISGATITTATGSGVVDGNGVPFWELFAANSSFARPTLVYINNSKNINITKLRFKNAPNVFHSVTGGSSNVIYDTLTLDATPKDGAVPKNTDGFDVGASQFVTLRNIKVSNQDDCVAFKPGANFTTVTDITCTGSHGISVGSLGGGAGSRDTVTNVYVTRATMINSTKAVGIKLYQGGSSHGIATVRNVTYDGVTVQNSDYAAQIQSCYGSDTTADCNSAPSQSIVDGVYFKNFVGTTSSKFDPVIANMNCPAAGTCNIFFSAFNVKSPTGKTNVLCSNVDSNMGLSCSGAASG